MIECPFCSETIDEEDLVFEFGWGDVSTFFYNKKQLKHEPKSEFRDRNFYVTFGYDWRGNAFLRDCKTSVNADKHPEDDPLYNDCWSEVVTLLSRKKTFDVECGDDYPKLPVTAKIRPMIKANRRGFSAEGVSTGMFCPICEQQLKPEVIKAETEVRIVLAGRPGSGKTVYVTQLISELIQGRLTETFNIEPANHSVHDHYIGNKNRLKVLAGNFVLATNPVQIQSPYIFLMSNAKSNIRLIIQDVAGEDTENRTKYSKEVRNADLALYFVDPWHIEEVRVFHKESGDPSNAIVDRSTNGRYNDLGGVFQQMMNSIDRTFTKENDRLAGVMLIKGDYLNPPMLAGGDQPECEMMQKVIPFDDPEEMEFSIGMRSSFIRQCMYEWESTRSFAREVENKYPAHNIRYFVASALGQSTQLRQVKMPTTRQISDNTLENPEDQFAIEEISESTNTPVSASDNWDYEEQMLVSPARADHVIDPVFWCLKRKGIAF